MRPWQFNTLFTIAAGGSLFMLLAPYLGLDAEPSPAAVTGMGAILTFVLTQKTEWTRGKDNHHEHRRDGSGDDDDR